MSDFHPGAETISERFFQRQGGLLSEGLVWRLVCQLLGALRAAHAAGAALRNVHPSRVLYCPVGDRVRANWVGCLDVLEYETRKQVPTVVAFLSLSLSLSPLSSLSLYIYISLWGRGPAFCVRACRRV